MRNLLDHAHSNVANGDIQETRPVVDSPVLPTSEGQIRALAKLPPTQQKKVWQKAVKEANGQPTAEQVEKAAKPKRSPRQSLIDAVKIALAIARKCGPGYAAESLDELLGQLA